MFLLDTVVLSETRKRQADSGVIFWINSVPPTDLFLSTITVSEIERGIERQRAVNAAFASELERWLEVTLRTYHDCILPLDVGSALRWGRLSARIGHKGLDLAIAATALEHGLTVVTRNVGHFEPSGVPVLNPFSSI
ncbi:MAG: type II toxin-antitoxin system VapC family toxin [Hyphomicrobiales bacterium]